MVGIKRWIRVCGGEEWERGMQAAIMHTVGTPARRGERARSAAAQPREAPTVAQESEREKLV